MKNPNFLVVDDIDTMRSTIKTHLLGMGFSNIHFASDGREAVRVIQSRPIDVIISDWNMPNMDGLELLKFIRGLPRLRDLPFLMVTAEANRELVEQAVAAGVDEFVIKPFTATGLRNKVTALNLGGERPRRAGGPDVAAALAAMDRPGPAPPEPEELEPEIPKGPASVLVVDDVASNIDVISGLLKEEYKVRAATSGAKALKICHSDNPPDLILLDIMMPEMDGMEVCRLLKSHAETEAIPIIFLTAKSENTDVVAGLEAGAVDYVTKPVTPSVLKARVKTHLHLSQSRDTLQRQFELLKENTRLREEVERITHHDLKNPLGSILSLSSMLADDNALANRHRESVQLIEESAFYMLSLLSRSLDLYKMETGTYPFEAKPVALQPLLAKVVAELAPQADAKRVHLEIDVPGEAPDAAGDELLCHSMVGNLVKNAIEAAPDGTRVKLAVKVGEGRVSIGVHNMGVVAEAIRERFFDKYVTHGKEGGTGIGTYSARLMAETQHGTITFTSSEEAGTAVSVTLPAVSES